MAVRENIDFVRGFQMGKDFLGFRNPLLMGDLEIHRLFIDGCIGCHEGVVEVEDDDVELGGI